MNAYTEAEALTNLEIQREGERFHRIEKVVDQVTNLCEKMILLHNTVFPPGSHNYGAVEDEVKCAKQELVWALDELTKEGT